MLELKDTTLLWCFSMPGFTFALIFMNAIPYPDKTNKYLTSLLILITGTAASFLSFYILFILCYKMAWDGSTWWYNLFTVGMLGGAIGATILSLLPNVILKKRMLTLMHPVTIFAGALLTGSINYCLSDTVFALEILNALWFAGIGSLITCNYNRMQTQEPSA